MTNKTRLEDMQLRFARAVTGAKRGTSHLNIYNELCFIYLFIYNEICWPLLFERHKNCQLNLRTKLCITHLDLSRCPLLHKSLQPPP